MVIAPDLVPERRGAIAFLSNIRREGDWILPRHFRALALLGNVELDLTKARLAPGTSEIELRSILGSVSILVPPDVRVDCEGDAVVGSFEVKRDAASSTSPDAPLLLITGTAYLGSVEVIVVDPNKRSFFEKLRERWG